MKMKISIVDNPVKEGSKRIVLHPGQTVSYQNFLDWASNYCTVRKPDIIAVLQLAKEWILSQSAHGQNVSLGPLGNSRLGMKGTFSSIPERINDGDVTLTINWQLPADIKTSIAQSADKLARKYVPVNSKLPLLYQITATGSSAQTINKRNQYLPSAGMKLDGHALTFDSSRADEGLFLLKDGSTPLKIERLIEVRPSAITFLMPDSCDGTYTPIIRKRITSDDKTPLQSPKGEPLTLFEQD